MTRELRVDQREALLDAHNKLKDILNYATDTYTLDLKHLGEIDEIVCMLHTQFNFRPVRDVEGHSMYWSGWEFDDDEV